ncbi:MAG: DUF6174 domain-containing protein [Pseudomonadota bacterium]
MILRTLVATALTGLMLLNLGCAKRDLSEELADVKKNRALWQQQNITDYSIFTVHSCALCPRSDLEVIITVKNSAMFSVQDSGRTDQVRFTVTAEQTKSFLTVDDLFNKIEDAIKLRVEALEVIYDSTYGFPTRLFIDYSKNSMDDEITISNRTRIMSTN